MYVCVKFDQPIVIGMRGSLCCKIQLSIKFKMAVGGILKLHKDVYISAKY